MFLFGALVFFPLFLAEMLSRPMIPIGGRGLIGILYGAICSSTLGYFFYNYAVKYIKTNEIGIFSYLEPFLTAIVAIPLLGEKITLPYVIGALFVFA